MTRSAAVVTALRCPACTQSFSQEVWTLIDAGERPDLLTALVEGSLEQVDCPRCGQPVPINAPLLLHEPALRRVFFAVPAETAEHTWREQAQELLYSLVDALPEEQRLPYLGDVQVEQERAGVRRALQRRGRRRAAAAPTPAPLMPAPQAAQTPPQSPLLDWIQALLAADNAHEFQGLVREQPALLEPATDLLIETLAEQARATGEPAVATAFQQLRNTLAQLRTAQANDAASAPEEQPTHTPGEPDAPGTSLSLPAYQALLAADSADQLVATIADFPQLLDASCEAVLIERSDQALEEGNERLAAWITARSDELTRLRQAMTESDVLHSAIQQLVHAHGEEPVAQTIAEYPGLLSDTAQQVLLEYAASASARGDHQLADNVTRYRTILREVRQGFEQH